MPGKLAAPFNSASAKVAGRKSAALRAAAAAAKRRAVNPPAHGPDSLSVRLALEREGLLELLNKEQRKQPPQPVRIKGFIEAIGKLLEIERKLKREGKPERNGGARPVPEPKSVEPVTNTEPIVREGSESSEERPTQTGTLSDYPG